MLSAEALEAYYHAQGIATFRALTEAAAELDIEFLVCEMGLHAMGLTVPSLMEGLSFTIGGIITLLQRVSGEVICL